MLHARRIGAIFYPAWQRSHVSCGVILPVDYEGGRGVILLVVITSYPGAETEPSCFAQQKHSVNTYWMHKIN